MSSKAESGQLTEGISQESAVEKLNVIYEQALEKFVERFGISLLEDKNRFLKALNTFFSNDEISSLLIEYESKRHGDFCEYVISGVIKKYMDNRDFFKRKNIAEYDQSTRVDAMANYASSIKYDFERVLSDMLSIIATLNMGRKISVDKAIDLLKTAGFFNYDNTWFDNPDTNELLRRMSLTLLKEQGLDDSKSILSKFPNSINFLPYPKHDVIRMLLQLANEGKIIFEDEDNLGIDEISKLFENSRNTDSANYIFDPRKGTWTLNKIVNGVFRAPTEHLVQDEGGQDLESRREQS